MLCLDLGNAAKRLPTLRHTTFDFFPWLRIFPAKILISFLGHITPVRLLQLLENEMYIILFTGQSFPTAYNSFLS